MKYHQKILVVWILIGCTFFSAAIARAQEGVDADTLLLLRFENSASGAQGELPLQSSGISYETGVLGQGVLVDASDILQYAAAENFNAPAGTIEFWVNPRQSFNLTGLNNCWFGAGTVPRANGSLAFEKIGNAFLSVSVNAAHGFVGAFIDDWQPNQWHYVAYTWSYPGEVKVYVDGAQKFSRAAVAQDVIAPFPSTLSVGSFNENRQADAVIDELRISRRARTAEEISQRMFSALSVSSLEMQFPLTEMYPTWEKTPSLRAVTNVGTLAIAPGAASWTSSDTNKATVDASGKIRAVAGGAVTITAAFGGVSASKTIVVKNPLLPLTYETVPPFLATPAAGYQYEIPVVIVRFLPTADGTTLDVAHDPDFYYLNPVPLSLMKQEYDAEFARVKFMMEEGSRFRGYNNANAPPSLGYRVVRIVTIYEPTPPGKAVQLNDLAEKQALQKGTLEACAACRQDASKLNSPSALPAYLPDYDSLMRRINAQQLVEQLGVKEFWVWQGAIDESFPSYDPNIHLPEYLRFAWESNMASPTTIDVSNSDADNADLPIYNRTYTLYTAHSRRIGNGLMAHNMGHQVEQQLTYVEWLRHADINTGNQYFTSDLFWKRFVGKLGADQFGLGRAGWTHMPPNTTVDYDYNSNYQLVPSDIAAWLADAPGVRTPVNADTWGLHPYAWTGGGRPASPSDRNEAQWYIYWRQSIPGLGNAIPFRGRKLTNWWSFIGDWDAGINSRRGLYDAARAPFDFDGDGKTELGIFRPSAGEWWFLRSSNGTNYAAQFGNSADQPVPADFTGDGKADIAFFRPSSGEWFVLRSEDASYYSYPFGTAGDVPTVGDFDGDGKADTGVFRPSSATWYIRKSSDGEVIIEQFGANGDVPAAADYDGDGKSDIAVYRPSPGEWWIQRSTAGITSFRFGVSTDKPVQGDYTGDGKADAAIFRPSTGEWFILRSEDQTYYSFPFGAAGDVPAPGDYDGDGKLDATVFRPSNSTWYANRSSATTLIQLFGQAGDLPLPSAYIP